MVITTDEAHFYLSVSLNRQNDRAWADSNPQIIDERPLHSQKVTVWCVVASFGIWDPYVFEEDDKAVTVTSDRYVDMLLNFIKPKLPGLPRGNTVWFQQDGATAHAGGKCLHELKKMFPGCIISLRGDIG